MQTATVSPLASRGSHTPWVGESGSGTSTSCTGVGGYGKEIKNDMDIVVDDREKKPYDFELPKKAFTRPNPEKVRVGIKRLAIGDYTVWHLERKVAVERKSLDDLLGTCSNKTDRRTRFVEELERLKKVWFSAVVLETSVEDLLDHKHKYSKINPKSVLGSALNWSMRYNVPFFFCTDRWHAEFVTYQILRQAFLWSLKNKRRKE